MSENLKIIEIEVLRYHPESDREPHLEVYKVPFTDDMSVLQGAQYIKDNFDGSLTFRWSCRMAICGSCGMMINGIPKLSCETFLRYYHPNRIRIEALAHFSIEKDLVVDLSGFIEKLESIQPYIIPRVPPVTATVQRLHSVHFLYQLHPVLRRLPAIWPQSGLHRPGRHCPAASLQHGLTRWRRRRTDGTGCFRRGCLQL